ncbi:hypothetical protein AJ78_00989 [Emergomyces pasteurianus Ep9510]|uniref:Acyltransferase 3 domain-containing protein n=1 Tax=Emergomyces pasteurianus Ep9510 TaxID=1447872 RepID=A0A1J9PS29_9EURO|nr:hypothetical protein AJ78_00989 [Emergomyces pasteurianus Ep9510]
MPPPKKRDDNWIDGLRGVASFVVVTGHLLSAFTPYLHSPSTSKEGSPLLLQLPILRLCVGGRSAVSIFFLVTGFVNSINPIKNADAGNTELALTNLAKSTFTRSARLVIPTNLAATVAWLVCHLGGFNVAHRADAPWIRRVSRYPSPTLWTALKELVKNWTIYWNDSGTTYDPVHWTVVYFLEGSMRIYLTLLATTLVSWRWRVAICAFLYSFAWCTNDYLVGINIYSGMFIGQLQASLGSRATSTLPRFVPPLIIFLGLLVCSFPQDNQHWTTWSFAMRRLMVSITPDAADRYISRYWVNVGSTILMTGIFFSRQARRVLTHPVFNFLGRCSFPVYLLHNTLLRTVLVWMIYGASAWSPDWEKVKEDGSPIELRRGGPGTFLVTIPVFYVTLYAVAYLWAEKVDPQCARVVSWMRDRMFVAEVELGRDVRAAIANGNGNGTGDVIGNGMGNANGRTEREVEKEQELGLELTVINGSASGSGNGSL